MSTETIKSTVENEEFDDVKFRSYDGNSNVRIPIYVQIAYPPYGYPEHTNGRHYWSYVTSATSDVLNYALLREYYGALMYSLFYSDLTITNESLATFYAELFATSVKPFIDDSRPIDIRYFIDNEWTKFEVDVMQLNKMQQYHIKESNSDSKKN